MRTEIPGGPFKPAHSGSYSCSPPSFQKRGPFKCADSSRCSRGALTVPDLTGDLLSVWEAGASDTWTHAGLPGICHNHDIKKVYGRRWKRTANSNNNKKKNDGDFQSLKLCGRGEVMR